MLNGNRRSLHVFLTHRGKELQEVVEEEFACLEEEAFRGIPEEQKESFMKLFLRIYENLSD